MLGKTAARHKLGKREDFRWRSEEITRIEGLTDAVFGFIVTLLIVSLEVPKNYNELTANLRGFVSFAAAFWQLMMVWYLQYIYFRRYGLQDLKSISLTMLLVFFVLFFAYPLKFMFNTWLNPSAVELDSASQLAQLFTIYGCAWMAIFGTFYMMYRHAWDQREELQLTELERWDTLHTRREMALYMLVGAIAVVIAQTVPPQWSWLSGPSYGLTGLVMSLHGRWSGKRRKLLEERQAAQDAEFELVNKPQIELA